ncbi:MAG TPA: FkbM family methyltransferase [Chthoniobacterales bacterium]|nr:FkbM family methyltransferase [Chthoniobacterales bacterium]
MPVTEPFSYRRMPRLVFLMRRLNRANYEREMELLDLLCDRNRPGIDVGAKVGMYTYRIRRHSSEVMAFEPIPMLNRLLRAVFEGRRGRIEPYAVSNQRGTAILRLPYDREGRCKYGYSTIEPANRFDPKTIAHSDAIEVETRRLDDYELPDVGFIKIDVEGHELAVLAGAEATLARHTPNLLIECNEEHQPDAVNRLGAWLDAHGYTAVFLDERELRPIKEYQRDVHWTAKGIENFIAIHRSRPDVLDRLTKRVAKRRPSR